MKVGGISIGNIIFGLNFPVDVGCRLKIVFPNDMPLTNDFKEVSADNINFLSEVVAPTISISDP